LSENLAQYDSFIIFSIIKKNRAVGKMT